MKRGGEGFLDRHVNKQANTILMDAAGVCLVMDVRLRAHAEQKVIDSFASW